MASTSTDHIFRVDLRHLLGVSHSQLQDSLLDAGWAQGGLDEVPPLAFVGLIGAFGPTLAALILSWHEDRGNGVRRLLKRLAIWRVHAGWYLFALFAAAVLLFVALLASRPAGFSLGPVLMHGVGAMVFSAIALTLPFGPVPEELGWLSRSESVLAARSRR